MVQLLSLLLLSTALLCEGHGSVHDTWEEVPVSTEQTGMLWAGCPKGYRGATRCMRLEVPLDYEDLQAGNTTIALLKHPSPKATVAHRPPEMIVMLEGPGRSSIEDFISGRFPSRHILGQEHDVIVLDPRGVGHSGPNVDCFGGDIGASYQLASGAYPFASSNITFENARVWGDWCKRNLNDTARYIGTPAVALDLFTYFERQARRNYGVRPYVNFYGSGYGVVVGATFATMYPHRVGRIVLDSPIEGHVYYEVEKRYASRDQSEAVRQSFKQCSEAGPAVCAFWDTTPEDVEERYIRLLKKLEDHPMQVPFSGAPVEVPIQITADSVRAGLLAATRKGHVSFRRLAALLTDLEQGRYWTWSTKHLKIPSCPRCTVNDWEFMRHAFESPVSKKWNQWAAYAITCSDLAPYGNFTLGEYEDLIRNSRDKNPYAGIESAAMAYCRHWPLTPPSSQQFRSFGSETRAPMLIIANAYDPVSPISYAREIQNQFPGSMLMEQSITAHGAASWGDCINSRVAHYFRTGRPGPYSSTSDAICKPGIMYKTTGKSSLPAQGPSR